MNDDTSSAAPPDDATRIEGFELLGAIGRGAMATVYRARTRHGEDVVVKVLAEDLIEDERAVARFDREIRTSMMLSHPGLVRALSSGEHEGRPYLVMELIEGTTIKRLLVKEGVFDERRAFSVAKQVAEALFYASSYHVIHRDIKPENIMLTDSGNAKLLDLGLAKATNSDGGLTRIGTVLGTPRYMSPEQAAGEDDVDFRSDMYSLGATLFHMLVGVPPFDGKPVEVISDLLYKDAPSPKDIDGRISDSCCIVINKLLSKRPQDRYRTWQEAVNDFESVLRGRETAAAASGMHRAVTQTAAKELSYRFSHVPSPEDVQFGRAALMLQAVTAATLLQALDRQERAAQVGGRVDLGALMLIEALIGEADKLRIDRWCCRKVLERSRETFLEVVERGEVVTATVLASARQRQSTGERPLERVLVEDGMLCERGRQLVCSAQSQVQRSAEDQLVLEIATQEMFISAVNARKCQVIQENGVMMGRYRPMAQVMLTKGYLEPIHAAVIVRAARRHLITGSQVHTLVREQRVDDDADDDRVSADSDPSLVAI